MGFFKKLLGLEQKPGEPVPLTDRELDQAISENGVTVFIYCFHLWCSSCQVMSGLLNEIGPDYVERAKFYKLDVSKNPASGQRFEVSGVPTIIALREGNVIDRHTGLIPLDPLKEWIESNLQQG